MSLRQYYTEPVNAFEQRLKSLFGNGELTPEYFGNPDEHVNGFSTRVDMHESDKEVKIFAELPGFKKEDIKVDVNEEYHSLLLSGENHKDKECSKGKARYSERRYGSFTRSLKLPSGAKLDEINAQFQDGVLKICIAKAPVKNQRSISIS